MMPLLADWHIAAGSRQEVIARRAIVDARARRGAGEDEGFRGPGLYSLRFIVWLSQRR
jgi:hypothetical protein